MSFLGKILVAAVLASMAALALGHFLDGVERDQKVEPEIKRPEPPRKRPPSPVIIQRR